MSLADQMTRCGGKRYRMCAYPVAGGAWGGFAESSRYYLGGARGASRRAVMIRLAWIVAADAGVS